MEKGYLFIIFYKVKCAISDIKFYIHGYITRESIAIERLEKHPGKNRIFRKKIKYFLGKAKGSPRSLILLYFVLHGGKEESRMVKIRSPYVINKWPLTSYIVGHGKIRVKENFSWMYVVTRMDKILGKYIRDIMQISHLISR